MKFKFNLKLTAFLVSLFIGLLLVILGNRSIYCLSFGFIFIAISLEFFVYYANEKTSKSISELKQEIDEVDADEELDNEDKVYILKQLYLRERKLSKSKKRVSIVFSICALSLVILGIVGIF